MMLIFLKILDRLLGIAKELGGYDLVSISRTAGVNRIIPIPSHNVTNEIDGFFRLARA
jgi:hypothetical protein